MSTRIALAVAAERAKMLQTIHDHIIKYGIENKMTCDEMATLITGLMIRTTSCPEELGAALGNIASKCITFSTHALAQVKAEGSA